MNESYWGKERKHMEECKDGHDGIQRWTWWTTQMDMVDYTDRHGGLLRWTWWTTEMDMVDYTDGHPMSISAVHHVHLCRPPCPKYL
jgi:hypothetical protein